MLSKEIVEKLLEKFESSKSFVDPLSKRRIELKLSEPFFNGLRNGSEKLDVALEMIELQNICEIRYKDDYLERIILKTDDLSIDKAYAFVGRSNPKNRLVELTRFFQNTKDSESAIVREFSVHALSMLERGKPALVENAYGTLDEIKDIVACIEAMDKLTSDVAERVFSSNVLGDSKKFALYRGKISKVIRDFSEMVFESDDDPIAAYGVIQNRTYAFVKGPLTISIGGQKLNLKSYGYELALSDEMIESMTVVSIEANQLFTIENLTSFNEFDCNDRVVVYLGGFHNSVRRKLIEKIHSSNPHIECFHYGDIDAGGFYILNHLREKTGIPFKPFRMDKGVLEQYSSKAKSLSKTDRVRLEKMRMDDRFAEFWETIDSMLDNNIKLEQEAELSI